MENKKFEMDIIESINEGNEMIIWDLIEGNIVRLPVQLKSLNSFAKQLFINIEDGFTESLAHFVRGPGLVKFYIPELQLAFVSELNSIHGNSLEVSYPVKEKRLERREHERFEPMSPLYCCFQNIKYEIYDISEGGVSFILGASQYEQLFKSKNDILNFEVDFNKDRIYVKGEVVDRKKIRPYQIDRFPYGAYRISVRLEGQGDYVKKVRKIHNGLNKLVKDLL